MQMHTGTVTYIHMPYIHVYIFWEVLLLCNLILRMWCSFNHIFSGTPPEKAFIPGTCGKTYSLENASFDNQHFHNDFKRSCFSARNKIYIIFPLGVNRNFKNLQVSMGLVSTHTSTSMHKLKFVFTNNHQLVNIAREWIFLYRKTQWVIKTRGIKHEPEDFLNYTLKYNIYEKTEVDRCNTWNLLNGKLPLLRTDSES